MRKEEHLSRRRVFGQGMLHPPVRLFGGPGMVRGLYDAYLWLPFLSTLGVNTSSKLRSKW